MKRAGRAHNHMAGLAVCFLCSLGDSGLLAEHFYPFLDYEELAALECACWSCHELLAPWRRAIIGGPAARQEIAGCLRAGEVRRALGLAQWAKRNRKKHRPFDRPTSLFLDAAAALAGRPSPENLGLLHELQAELGLTDWAAEDTAALLGLARAQSVPTAWLAAKFNSPADFARRIWDPSLNEEAGAAFAALAAGEAYAGQSFDAHPRRLRSDMARIYASLLSAGETEEAARIEAEYAKRMQARRASWPRLPTLALASGGLSASAIAALCAEERLPRLPLQEVQKILPDSCQFSSNLFEDGHKYSAEAQVAVCTGRLDGLGELTGEAALEIVDLGFLQTMLVKNWPLALAAVRAGRPSRGELARLAAEMYRRQLHAKAEELWQLARPG